LGPASGWTTRAWPVFGSVQGYRMSWLRPDVLAGLTVWAVLVPEALVVVGPMSATAALSAAIVAPFAAGDPARHIALTAALVSLGDHRVHTQTKLHDHAAA
jgi:sulfate permease, SulP family